MSLQLQSCEIWTGYDVATSSNKQGQLLSRFDILLSFRNPSAMLTSSFVASLFLAAASVQAAPFFPAALQKRAEPQTAQSIDKHVHTNSTQVQIQYVHGKLENHAASESLT